MSALLSAVAIALVLNVVAFVLAIVIMVKAFRISLKWGFFFLFMPIVFVGLSMFLGPLLAGLVVIGLQVYFVKTNWERVGKPFMAMLVCWVGSTAIGVAAKGWIPKETLARFQDTTEVQQAGAAAGELAEVESYLDVSGGKIWYRRAGTGALTPVILVHGGPGMGSYYLKSLEVLRDERPVVRYDQLGGGRSERVDDPSLFTIQRFVAELDSLRAALGYETAHIVGHSWGTIVAVEYYRAHPARVASLTLASAVLSGPELARNTRRLVATLSDSAKLAIRTREALHDYDAPDYLSAVNEFNGKYRSLRPDEANLDSTMKTMNQSIYRHMWGPSEFTLAGTLKTYDATSRLRTIRVPTLYTVGEHDEAGPAIVKRFAALTPGAKLEVIPNAAHVTTWDNPDEMVRIVREFLRAVEAMPKQ